MSPHMTSNSIPDTAWKSAAAFPMVSRPVHLMITSLTAINDDVRIA